MSDEVTHKTKSKVTSVELAKRLKLEKKRSQSYKLKQLKTLKLLKAAKKKLLKYKQAYLKLKAAGATGANTEKLALQNKKLNESLGKYQDRLNKTLKLLKESKSELKDSHKALAMARSENQGHAELERLQKHLEKLEVENVALQAQTERLGRELAEERERAGALEKKLEESDAARQAFENESAKARDTIARLEQGRAEQTAKLTALAESFTRLQANQKAAGGADEEALLLAQSEVEELRETLETVEQERADLSSELDQVKKQLAGRETEHEEALLKLWDLEERIQDQGSDVSGALEAKNAEIEEVKKKVKELGEQLTVEESEKEKALGRLKESRDEATRLEEEREALTKELDESKERIAVLMSAGQNLKTQIAKQTEFYEKLKSEHSSVQEELATLKTRLSEVQQTQQISEAPETREPAEKRATKAEVRLKEVEEKLVETRAKLLSSHTQMEQLEHEKKAVEVRNSELEKELTFGASQLQQLESLISLLEQKEETHIRQLAAMRRQITELLEDNGRLKEELGEKSGRLLTVERSFEETDESLANIRRRYETTKEALELNKSQLTEARNRALLNLTRAEEAEKKFSKADHEAKVVAEENKVLKRRMERLQERVAELEMLS